MIHKEKCTYNLCFLSKLPLKKRKNKMIWPQEETEKDRGRDRKLGKGRLTDTAHQARMRVSVHRT